VEFDGTSPSPAVNMAIFGRKTKYKRIESMIFNLSDKMEHDLYRDLLNKHATGEIDILLKKDYSYQKSEMLYMHVEWGIK
jgi:hypothetical protein